MVCLDTVYGHLPAIRNKTGFIARTRLSQKHGAHWWDEYLLRVSMLEMPDFFSMFKSTYTDMIRRWRRFRFIGYNTSSRFITNTDNARLLDRRWNYWMAQLNCVQWPNEDSICTKSPWAKDEPTWILPPVSHNWPIGQNDMWLIPTLAHPLSIRWPNVYILAMASQKWTHDMTSSQCQWELLSTWCLLRSLWEIVPRTSHNFNRPT